jgi:iron complex transport system ATP-binding protein
VTGVQSAARPLLELRGLSSGYRRGIFGKEKAVLTGIDLSIHGGELIVLAGPNGSGKTTLLKTAGGLLKPLAGKVFVEGRDGSLLSKKEWAFYRAYIFQAGLPSWPFTVYEIVSQGRYSRVKQNGANKNAVRRAIAEAGLEGFEERPVTELSGGEYQRALLARAMAQEAKILLLDEPCSSLDPRYRIVVMDLLKKIAAGGAAVLASFHDLDLAARYADRAVLVGGGRARGEGTPREMFSEDSLKEIF